MPLIHDADKKISLFGMKILNELVSNEGTHEQIIQIGASLKESMQTRLYDGIVKIWEQKTGEKLENMPDEDKKAGLVDSFKRRALLHINDKSINPITIV